MSKVFLFINTHYLPDSHFGGVVESGSKLLKFLRRVADFRLSTVSRTPHSSVPYLAPGDHCYRSLGFHRFAFSLVAITGLWRDIRSCDVALINGIFTFPVTLAALYAVIQNKPFIVATRGGLEPWRVAHKKWKKYLYIKFITLPLMRRARYVHVTSREEGNNIRALGFKNTINISNGIDAEEFANLPGRDKAVGQCGSRFVFLFLSRTDKEKGLDILLAAYRRFCSDFPTDGHVLCLVGPDHQGYLKGMNLDYVKENIERMAGVYGADKLSLLRRADVLVLPSYSENFGNVVAEALACETPVITTTGTPWAELEKVGCGLYIEPTADKLFEAMNSMYRKTKAERQKMGCKGRQYIFENFNWEAKAKELFEYLRRIGDEDNK